jgi:steroid delta-isomerase-like uncharacterized protein
MLQRGGAIHVPEVRCRNSADPFQLKLYLTAFPDLHLDMEAILPAGESHVVVRWRSSGTHKGPLANLPATGRKGSVHGCSVMEVKNQKIAHAWVYFDNAHLLRQLGVLPA